MFNRKPGDFIVADDPVVLEELTGDARKMLHEDFIEWHEGVLAEQRLLAEQARREEADNPGTRENGGV